MEINKDDQGKYNALEQAISDAQEPLTKEQRITETLKEIGVEVLKEEHVSVVNLEMGASILALFGELEDGVKSNTLETFRDTVQYVADNEVSGLIGILSPIIGQNLDHVLHIKDTLKWATYLEEIGV